MIEKYITKSDKDNNCRIYRTGDNEVTNNEQKEK